MLQDYDIIIVGAGLAGLATAYYLTRDLPLKILLLEKENAVGLHASGKNAAMLRQAVPNREIAAFIQETLRNLENPAEDWSQQVLLKQCGSLLLGTQRSLMPLHQSLEAVGGTAAIYPFGKFPNQLPQTLQTQLLASNYEFMLYTPRDGIVDVQALLQSLLKSSQQKGTCVRLGEAVKALNFKDHVWNVLSSQNQYRAPIVVNAAGAWAPQLASAAGGLGEKMQAFRRHLYLSSACEMAVDAWPLVWNINEEFYFRSQQNKLLLSAGDEEAHSSLDSQEDPHVLNMLREKAKRLFPALQEIPIEQSWACLRTKTNSGNFFIDWDKQVKNLFWVSALGGHGVGASLGVGRQAAEKILKNESLR